MEKATRLLQEFFTTSGRIDRRTFLKRNFIFFITLLVLHMLIALFPSLEGCAPFFVLPLYYGILTLCVRRLHDAGRKGWWCLLFFVPILGMGLLLYLAFAGSAENR